jgi:hypothetical protein
MDRWWWVQVCAVIHNFCLGYDTPSYISELIDKFESTRNKEHFTNNCVQRIKLQKNSSMNLADKNNNDDNDRVISSVYDKPTANSSKWKHSNNFFWKIEVMISTCRITQMMNKFI